MDKYGERELIRKCPECQSSLFLDQGEELTMSFAGFAPVAYCRKCGHQESPKEGDYKVVMGNAIHARQTGLAPTN